MKKRLRVYHSGAFVYLALSKRSGLYWALLIEVDVDCAGGGDRFIHGAVYVVAARERDT